jgi:hypothetical protein
MGKYFPAAVALKQIFCWDIELHPAAELQTPKSP